MSCERSDPHRVAALRHPALRMLMLAACGAFVSAAYAASVPQGFADREIASGIVSPTSMAALPDGRVLVVQQDGVIRLIRDDALTPDNYYAVANVDSFAERGCLGITPDPDFEANRYIYLYCTVQEAGNSFNRVLRITDGGDRAAAGSEQNIFTLPRVPDGVQWHMGGALRFGVDGKLYIAVGGHEDLREPVTTSSSQNLSSPFGKILRINADGTIPPDNPFVNTPNAFAANFNLGLRNPFTIDIQPGTGLIYINDVGAGSWEEINQGLPGANYGWPAFEGNTDDSRYTNAVFAYGRAVGCAITGGAFYNPQSPQFPSTYVGKYLLADFCAGTIRYIDPAAPTAAQDFASGIDSPVNIGVSPNGDLYYLARNQAAGATNQAAGTVGKISFTNSQLPRIAAQPQSQTIFIGDSATFTVRADGASSIQWQRNGVDIPGANAATLSIPSISQADHQARFTAVVSNAFGSTASNPAMLSVTTNRFPVATITAPAAEGGFAPGDTISYAGTGTDAEDGTLVPSAFSWKVDFMHDTHTHPFMAATRGATSGTFTAPNFEAEAANTWLRMTLSVTDSAGQTHVAVRDLYPRLPLTDMAVSGVPANGLGPIERNRHNGDAAAGDGGTITLDRIPYAKGLGVHAPSEVRYNIASCTGNFIADVGIDDSVGSGGSAVFQVWLDGAQVFDSGIVRGTDLRKTINVSVAGKSELRLVVTDAGDGNASDRANWAGARVTGCPASLAQPATDVGAVITPPAGSGGGGGGCAIGGTGRFDPTLPALLAASIATLVWRRRKTQAAAPNA